MENKEIRFIDSHYNELFRIPDGGQITIHYPDGHKENRVCQYIDDYHTYINGVCFHICQFAEIMEQNKQTYTPAEPKKYILENVSQEEFLFMYNAKDNAKRGCAGYVRADFGTGKDFYSNWFSEDKSLKNKDFESEIDSVINYFRENSDTPLLKSRSDMYNTCYKLKPTVFVGNSDVRGFKVETEKHTYYFKCNPRQGDYNLYLYCYDTQALQIYKDLEFVEQHYVDIDKDKFFKTDNGITEVYYNPDANSGGQLVYLEISNADIENASKECATKDDFFAYIESAARGYLVDIGTSAFMENAKSFINRKADFEGCTDKTMKGLKKFAGVEKTKPPKEPER